MSTTAKTDPSGASKSRAQRITARTTAASKRKHETIAAPQANLSKRIGWLRRKTKLYVDKIEP